MYLYKYTIKSKQTRIIKIKNQVGIDLCYKKWGNKENSDMKYFISLISTSGKHS